MRWRASACPARSPTRCSTSPARSPASSPAPSWWWTAATPRSETQLLGGPRRGGLGVGGGFLEVAARVLGDDQLELVIAHPHAPQLGEDTLEKVGHPPVRRD